MTLLETPIPGLILMQPRVFGDERGYFFESLRRDALPADVPEFVQHNESMSKRGVLRGLHFQVPPRAQGKLVSVVRGSVYDVAVDIRVGSPTYGQHFGLVLDTVTKHRLYIPPGFAHGFLTLEDHTIFSYKCTNYYNKESEGAIRWNSPTLKIDWDIVQPNLSDKDKLAPLFKDFKSPFSLSNFK